MLLDVGQCGGTIGGLRIKPRRGAGLPIRTAESGEISMIGHHTKHAVRPPSQIFPSEPGKVASDATLDETHVLLCDWHGVVVWKSGTGDRVQIGELIWKHASKKSCDLLKTAIASVATLQEQSTLEIENERGEHFRLRMWPLHEPDIAICILAIRIPNELASLTERERAASAALLRANRPATSPSSSTSDSRRSTPICAAAEKSLTSAQPKPSSASPPAISTSPRRPRP